MLKTKKPNLSDLQALVVNPAHGGTVPIELPGNINSLCLKPKNLIYPTYGPAKSGINPAHGGTVPIELPGINTIYIHAQRSGRTCSPAKSGINPAQGGTALPEKELILSKRLERLQAISACGPFESSSVHCRKIHPLPEGTRRLPLGRSCARLTGYWTEKTKGGDDARRRNYGSG
jgi:hypothetical protein